VWLIQHDPSHVYIIKKGCYNTTMYESYFTTSSVNNINHIPSICICPMLKNEYAFNFVIANDIILKKKLFDPMNLNLF